MISLVTVALNRLEPFWRILCESLAQHATLIKEVLILNVEQSRDVYKEWKEKDITFRFIGAETMLFPVCDPTSFCAQHAMGLEEGIQRASQEYVMLCDPDVFFYLPVDEYYMDLMQKYDLDYIGASHPNSVSEAFGFFPNILNSLVKKDKLPSRDYLCKEFKEQLLTTGVGSYIPHLQVLPRQDRLEIKRQHRLTIFEHTWEDSQLPGLYLFPGQLTSRVSSFPNPEGHYETGCSLVLYAQEQNWKWLSFQTGNCHNYGTQFSRNNFKLRDKPPRKTLFYHAGLASGNHNRIALFTEAYNKTKNEEE